ncbi:MAG: hypothetical protein GY715_06480 [Planctomycetes bacterium]|nr:hypothetical protein [Planctomycetota bacterium]
MSQFNAPVRRGGGIDVYTGLMFVAFLVLAAGVGLLAMRNMDHSAVGTQSGGPIKLID